MEGPEPEDQRGAARADADVDEPRTDDEGDQGPAAVAARTQALIEESRALLRRLERLLTPRDDAGDDRNDDAS